ncbi:ribonuclease H-like domain-containing protein [Mycotypha africana]|uniref:ribonuclease H-like domain-containing protein n=1 Tax=Mycotypha africana TaxID=64632 RepID=UPI002300A1F1|nr:ribonuclease H-like domain-containing protein [Mycotypha africana]KAI8973710.1 ribonuclease H-like domain-containing protein [Mycotypha africana]
MAEHLAEAPPSTAYVFNHIEVTRSNLKEVYSHIIRKVSGASHIAIDFEFTGLGKKSSVNNIHHHYLAIKQAVEQHSIVSFGLSIARENDLTASSADKSSLHNANIDNSNSRGLQYEFDNFNFLTLIQGPILFSKGTGTWLAASGFDFNKFFLEGIPFQPPLIKKEEEKELNSSSSKSDDKSKVMLSKLLNTIVDLMKYKKIPLVLHNGLHDIMYLYYSFIGPLPDTFPEFLTKIATAFPSGIYDTKFMAYTNTFNATFLSYLFAKCDRLRIDAYKDPQAEIATKDNQSNKNNKTYFDIQVNDTIIDTTFDKVVEIGSKRKSIHFEIETERTTIKKRSTSIEENTTTTKDNSLNTNRQKKIKVCRDYAMKGYCSHPNHTNYCEEHDIQLVLNSEMGPSNYPTYYTCNLNDGRSAHSAYFDAYMTAFIYCYLKHTLSLKAMDSAKNRIRIDFAPEYIQIPTLPAEDPSSKPHQQTASSQVPSLSSQISTYSSQTVSSQE